MHEYSQFASIIKKLLAYRHQKNVQYEMTQDALVTKREYLEELEKSEHEARRLGEALARGRLSVPSNQPNQQQNSPTSSSQEIVGEESPDNDPVVEHNQANSWPTALPAHPGPNPARRKMRNPGMGLLNALSYTFHGMMDVDPETARRNSITKTRETISQVKMSTLYLARAKCLTFLTHKLEDALHLSTQDLKYSSSTIQADLDRFQRQKVADLREMAINMARSHREWCKEVCWLCYI